MTTEYQSVSSLTMICTDERRPQQVKSGRHTSFPRVGGELCTGWFSPVCIDVAEDVQVRSAQTLPTDVQ